MTSRSARAHIGRPPKGLAYMDLNAEQTRLLDDQVRLVVQHQIERIDSHKPLADQFKELARNCYLQGVLDGNQVPRPHGVPTCPGDGCQGCAGCWKVSETPAENTPGVTGTVAWGPEHPDWKATHGCTHECREGKHCRCDAEATADGVDLPDGGQQ